MIAACVGAAGPSTTPVHLPNTSISAMKVDAAGNSCLAGFLGVVGKPDTYDVFVAKLSPDGSKMLYSTRFSGSSSD
jgi:hypothetical protein